MRQSTTTALLVGVLAALVPLAHAETKCDATTKCPSNAPCCSPFGYCNTGNFCLGGCQPLCAYDGKPDGDTSYSFKESSCAPLPVCKDMTTNFSDLSRVLTNGSKYNGNASAWDWVVEKGTLEADPEGNGARLTLTQEHGGTLLSSTRYVHYGQIDFDMQASRWGGVVSAAITMSNVKDEIDWEWPGDAVTEGQTNFFFLGIANYSATDGATHGNFSDISRNFHTWSFNWQEDYLEWLVDGKVIRTVYKNQTLDAVTGQPKYPSTPSRVQISIWPAGIDGTPEGTVKWAGGMIDWSNEDYVTNGYFHNTIRSVTIKCADSQQAVDSGVTGITGYEFSGNDTNDVPIIKFTNRSTVPGSGALRSIGAGAGVAGVFLAAAVAVVPSFMTLF